MEEKVNWFVIVSYFCYPDSSLSFKFSLGHAQYINILLMSCYIYSFVIVPN